MSGPSDTTAAAYAPTAWNMISAKFGIPAQPNWRFSAQASSASMKK